MKNILAIPIYLTVLVAQTVDYTEIQDLWDEDCISCHISSHSSGLNLTSGNSLGELVDVPSEGANYGGALRVASGDPGSSVLYDKITGGGTYGQQMPPYPNSLMITANRNLVQTWITELSSSNSITIAAARALAIGSSAIVQGIVTSPNFGGYYTSYTIQDSTAGIVVYASPSAIDPPATLALGDKVEVTGTIDEYPSGSGIMEIVPSGADDITVLSSGNTLPDAQEVTVATLLTNGEDYESEIIVIDSVSITSGTWPDEGNSANLTITDDNETSTITMRIDSDTDIDGQTQPQEPFIVTAVIGQYNDHQVQPRYYTDFAAVGAVVPTIADVTMDPASPTDADDVTISASITDDGTIVSATLTYDNGSGDTDVTMSNTSGDTYAGTVPAQTSGTTVSYIITATDNDGNSTTSDEGSYTVLPSAGTITSIYDIQYVSNPDSNDASPLDGQTVSISGIVTAEFWGSSSNRYLYVQDAEGPWNGIVCFEYNGWDEFDFASAVGIVHSVAEGDSVTVTGTVDEYYGLTEIVDVTEVVIHGPAENMISPSVANPGQLMTDGTDSEAYEGCLVKVDNVSVDNADLGNGEWSVTDGTNAMRVDDIWDYYYFPESGQALAGVAGVMTYTYSDAKLEPRLARDVVEADGTPVRLQRIQQVLYSDLIKAGVDEESDMSYMYGDTVTVVGIVTMPTGLSYAGAGIKFIFQDENGGPWSSILSYDPDSSAFPVLYEGDSIQATGYVYEYSTGPANMTELFITEPVNILEVGVALPDTADVNTGDLRWPTEAEQWGTVMVRATDAIVVESDLPFGEWSIDDGTGKVNVDDDSDSIIVWQEAVGRPPVGSYVSSIRGWVYHHYGTNADSTAYKIEPLYVADIEFGAGPPNITDVSRDPCVPGVDDVVTVSAVITDNSTISEAHIYYRVDDGDWNIVDMSNTVDDTWSGSIPASGTDGAFIEYFIKAADDGADQSEIKWSEFPDTDNGNYLGYDTSSSALTINNVQHSPWPNGKSPYNGCDVTVTGIVTADTAQYNSGYAAYAFQSASAQWSGVVFDGWDDSMLSRGDEVTVSGTVEEFDPEWHFKYDGNTKLINVSAVTVNSAGNSMASMSVSTADLGQDAEEVESYEGCLVTVSGVTISAMNAYDWGIIDDSGVECLIDDDMATIVADNYMSTLEEGTTLSQVTGIFNFSFGTYKIQVRDLADLGQLGVDENFESLPRRFALYNNYPNPFNPETRIRFEVGKQENVRLIIYDMLGRKVRTLVNDNYNPGMYVINWDGMNDSRQPVSSGPYLYRIKAGEFIDHKKMILVR